MARPRKTELNDATRDKIKDISRELMATRGTAGLSMRAIARDLGMSPPALYHYYSSLDDLITALVVDAFLSHTAAVDQAMTEALEAGLDSVERLKVGVQAYRRWALDHRTEFQLIYGNPIPGYHAPADATEPAARSMSELFVNALTDAVQRATIHPGDGVEPPSTAVGRPSGHTNDDPAPGLDRVLQAMSHAWCAIHGATSLEVHNHLQPVVGDPDTFFEQLVDHNLRALGLTFP